MSELLCKCGAVISDVLSPCPTEGTVIGCQDYDVFDDRFTARVADFLDAVRQGQRERWIDMEVTNDGRFLSQ